MTIISRPLIAIAMVAVVAVAAAVAIRSSAPASPNVARGELIPAEHRQAAPDARRPLLVGDGELGLGDLRGDPIVVNFWASWCGPCRAEQPDLNRVYDDYQPLGVQFLGVDIQDTRPNGRAHVREFDIPYDSLFDPDSSYAADFGGIGPRAIPTTLLIDHQGRVASRLFGITTYEELSLLLDRLLLEDGRP